MCAASAAVALSVVGVWWGGGDSTAVMVKFAFACAQTRREMHKAPAKASGLASSIHSSTMTKQGRLHVLTASCHLV
jgi:hypothetical protein